VRVNALVRDRAEHPLVFRLGMRNVLAEGRDHLRVARFGQEMVKRLRDPTRAAVRSGQIGRQKQDAAKILRDARTGLIEEAAARPFNFGARNRFSLKIKPGHGNSVAYVPHRGERHGKSFRLS
jgi:hypothetical protein